MRRSWTKHEWTNWARAVATVACLLCFGAGAEAKLVPVEQPPAAAGAQTAQPNNSKSGAPAAAPAGQNDDDRLPFMIGPEREAESAPPSAVGMMARTFGALLLVIGLLIGGTWCLRRLKGSPFAAGRDDVRLVVLKTISIGDRRTLTLVRFGDRTLLLGSTPQSVSLLASDDEEDLSAWSSSTEPPFRSVADVLAASEDEDAQPAAFAGELERIAEWRNSGEGGRRENDNRSAKWR